MRKMRDKPEKRLSGNSEGFCFLLLIDSIERNRISPLTVCSLHEDGGCNLNFCLCRNEVRTWSCGPGDFMLE